MRWFVRAERRPHEWVYLQTNQATGVVTVCLSAEHATCYPTIWAVIEAMAACAPRLQGYSLTPSAECAACGRLFAWELDDDPGVEELCADCARLKEDAASDDDYERRLDERRGQ